jgi:hypothetical protein
MKDWRDGLGLLERTTQRRMEDALSVLAECDFYAHGMGCKVDDPIGIIRQALEGDEWAGSFAIELKDVLKVLERLGEIIMPTTEQKEDNGTNIK